MKRIRFVVARPAGSHPVTARDQILQGLREIFHHVGMHHAVLIHEQNSLRAGLQRPSDSEVLRGSDAEIFSLAEDFKRHANSTGSLGSDSARASIVDYNDPVALRCQCREHLCKACGIWMKGRDDGSDGQR